MRWLLSRLLSEKANGLDPEGSGIEAILMPVGAPSSAPPRHYSDHAVSRLTEG